MGFSVKKSFKKAVKSVSGAAKRTFKNYTSKEFLTSPGRWVMAGTTYGLSEATNMGNWYSNQKYTGLVDLALAAAIGANAASTLAGGGAVAAEGAGTAATSTGAGATAAGTTAGTAGGAVGGAAAGGAAAAGGISGTTLAMGGLAAASALGTIQQQKVASKIAKEQRAAEAQARADADAAARESEILRKQALLASQKSMTARRSAAGAIANKLKNTQTNLGSDEEKLGD